MVVVLSLLFSQLALASCLCPAEAPPHDMAAMMAAGVPCEEMDESPPALCHQHAADPGQVAQAAQVLAPSLPIVIQILWLPLALPADAVAVPHASTPEALLTYVLDRLTPQEYSAASQGALTDYARTGASYPASDTQLATKVAGLVHLVVGSGDYQFI